MTMCAYQIVTKKLIVIELSFMGLILPRSIHFCLDRKCVTNEFDDDWVEELIHDVELSLSVHAYHRLVVEA